MSDGPGQTYLDQRLDAIEAGEQAPQLSPASYLYQRARQIQEELLPRIAAEKEKIQPIADSQLAQLTEMEAVLKAEFAVLEAASTVLPAEVVPISELAEGGGE